jgi:hypothetical protein
MKHRRRHDDYVSRHQLELELMNLLLLMVFWVSFGLMIWWRW